jgi:hypothetical protein
MRSLLVMALLGATLLGAAWPIPAAAQPARPPAPPPGGGPAMPPPPGSGLCTQLVPCTGALGERFYYTRSGDKRIVNRR